MNLLQIHEPGQTPLPHEDTAAVGIDLGTTHSVVAIALEDRVEVIDDPHGNRLLPSVVHYGADGQAEVGMNARRRHADGEAGVAASIKRLMGRGIEDVKPLLGALPYEVEPGEGMVRLRLGGKVMTPVDIAADILRALKSIAQDALGKDVTKAVITVPAYFDDAARTATKDAARLAGLEVLRLIAEPTAAALAYGLDHAVEGIYAVYDLGGGTFDFSLLKLEKGVFQVLATGGDTALGGDDFDHAIAVWLIERLGIGNQDIRSEELGRITMLAREAKHALSQATRADITYRGHTVVVERKQFEALISPMVETTASICAQVVADAGLSPREVQGVVMVGGSTRIPLVCEAMERLFGKPPLTDVNPDEVVAVGAAIQARGLTQGSDTLLLDVVPLSLGLETMGGLTEKLIARNTPIPVSVSQEFTTWQDGQDGMQIHVVQGEREMVTHNRSLGRFELTGIPPMPVGMARVRVTFTVDADGLLTVSAEETLTGKRQEVQIRPSYGLPAETIEAMLRESMAKGRDDIGERLLAEARMEAERAVMELQSAMRQDGDLLEEHEQKRLDRQITVLRNALEGDDRDYIDAELHELARLAEPFAQRRMDRAVAVALKGAHIDHVG